MPVLVRNLVTFIGVYAIVLLLIPKRWLPPDGAGRAEKKALVGVGVVALLVAWQPVLLAGVILIWLGELTWHRLRKTSP